MPFNGSLSVWGATLYTVANGGRLCCCKLRQLFSDEIERKSTAIADPFGQDTRAGAANSIRSRQPTCERCPQTRPKLPLAHSSSAHWE